MCQASARFDSLPKAQIGDDIVVTSEYGRNLFAKAAKKRTRNPEFCCIPSGSTLVISNLPVHLQQRLGIGPEVVAVMISPDADRTGTDTDRDDEFEVIITGQRFFLNELEAGTAMRRVNPVRHQAVQTPPAETEQPIQIESEEAPELVGMNA